MKRYWMFRKGKFLLWAVVAISIFGLVVMGLWNWLMPALFGWNEIGFLQAVGLLILSIERFYCHSLCQDIAMT